MGTNHLHSSDNQQMHKLKSISIRTVEAAAMDGKPTLLSKRVHWAELAHSRDVCYLSLLRLRQDQTLVLRSYLLLF